MVRIEHPTYKCDQCNKDITEGITQKETNITVVEHSYNHEHHFCDSTCIGNWAKPWATK